jgi:hypothetical protein
MLPMHAGSRYMRPIIQQAVPKLFRRSHSYETVQSIFDEYLLTTRTIGSIAGAYIGATSAANYGFSRNRRGAAYTLAPLGLIGGAAIGYVAGPIAPFFLIVESAIWIENLNRPKR